MKTLFIILLGLTGLFITCPAFGQRVNVPESRLWIRGGAGLFESDGALTTPNYQTAVFDVGFVRSRTIFNQYLGFEYGGRVGFKARRETYLNKLDENGSQELGLNPLIDMTVSDAGHYYLGAPILLSLNVKNTELKAGTELRFWMGSNRHLINYLSGRPDIGLIVGLNQKLGDRFIVGVEGILGTLPAVESFADKYYNRELKVGVGFRLR